MKFSLIDLLIYALIQGIVSKKIKALYGNNNNIFINKYILT